FELNLRALSVFDVNDEAVPVCDPTFRVVERFSRGLNPSILTIGAAETIDIFVRRTGRGRMQPPSYGRVAMVGMDEFQPSPAGQALCRVAEIFHGPLIQVVQLTVRVTAPYQCGDGLS